jgi:hypothetical protein
MTAFAGLRGTGDWGTDERPKNFREGILWAQPDGTSPIFALTSKTRKGKATTDPEFSWWNETNTLINLQVNGALTASDTTVVVDSADPTGSAMTLNYGNATHLKPGDLLLVIPATDSATYDHEIIRVEYVSSATSFVVTRGVAGTTAAAIANDLYLTLIGSAYAEGTGAPESVARNPIKFYNYTQIFKDSYEITGTADETDARTGKAWGNDKKRKSFKHSMDIEMAILFGQRSESTGTNGKPLRTMGGLRTFIPSANQTIISGAVTGAKLIDAIAPVFDFETGAGNTRMAFGGNLALTDIGKAISATTNVKMELGSTVKQWGIDFQELIMPRGKILFKSHPLLSRHPLYQRSMFVLDFDSIRWVPMKNRDTKTMDDVQNKDEDVRRGLIMTEGSLAVEYGGMTNAYIGGISAT